MRKAHERGNHLYVASLDADKVFDQDEARAVERAMDLDGPLRPFCVIKYFG